MRIRRSADPERPRRAAPGGACPAETRRRLARRAARRPAVSRRGSPPGRARTCRASRPSAPGGGSGRPRRPRRTSGARGPRPGIPGPAPRSRPALPARYPSRTTPVPSAASDRRLQPVSASVSGSRPTASQARAIVARIAVTSATSHSARLTLAASPQRAATSAVRSPSAATHTGGPSGRGPRGTITAPSVRTWAPSKVSAGSRSMRAVTSTDSAYRPDVPLRREAERAPGVVARRARRCPGPAPRGRR